LIDPQFDAFQVVLDNLKPDWVTHQVKRGIVVQTPAGFS